MLSGEHPSQTETKPISGALLAKRTGSAITPEMQKCLTQIGGGDGTITRYPGGFWYPAGDGKPSFGTTTVQALVNRVRLEYLEWKQSKGLKFTIKARIPPDQSSLSLH